MCAGFSLARRQRKGFLNDKRQTDALIKRFLFIRFLKTGTEDREDKITPPLTILCLKLALSWNIGFGVSA